MHLEIIRLAILIQTLLLTYLVIDIVINLTGRKEHEKQKIDETC